MCLDEPPYPRSSVIRDIHLGPQRISRGSGDNWPMAWADDGDIYTVYCDGEGWGDRRYSMGMARVLGTPPDISGENIHSPTGERGPADTGYDKRGRKACGMVMAQGILYMWVRNLTEEGTGSSLAWSADHARTWTWAEWSLPELGYPVWLDCGRNSRAAPDRYLYFYSPDTPSAYETADTIMLGRVPVGRVAEPAAYEFFCGDGGRAEWTRDLAGRRAVFRGTGLCYRPGATRVSGLGRYLLTMATKAGHLGIYEAPAPWGPWKTALFTDEFGIGEDRFQPLIPSKWVTHDGLAFHLVYSCYPRGPYQLNVQRCTVMLHGPGGKDAVDGPKR